MAKERPIIFSAPMVRAILDGRKTQTRRALNPQPDETIQYSSFASHGVLNGKGDNLVCRFGKPGDRLWVKETFAKIDDESGFGSDHIEYKATRDCPDKIIWTSSIFMPRRASRITLEIVNLRIERLQDLSQEDAVDEGVKQLWRDGEFPYSRYEYVYFDIADKKNIGITENPILAYRGIWESINGAGSWDLNPFVWVLEFRKIDAS